MEGHERNLEAHSGNEEHHAQNAEPAFAIKQGAKLVEVERAGAAINQREAIEQQRTGEEGQEDKLGACLYAFVAVFVVGHKGGHRDRSQLQADEEHQEVAAGNHKVHTEQRKEGEQIELALLHQVLFAAEPLMSHEEDNERTYIEHGLYDGHHRSVQIHATKG